MKSLRTMMLGLIAVGVFAVFSSISYAAEAQEQAKVKILNDSAAALQQLNPGLAASLTKFANEEATEKQEKNEGNKEQEGTKEEGMMNKVMGHIKLLRDSASALKQSNPALALSLMQMADRSEQRMENKQQEEKNEKEDTGSVK